MKINFIPAKRFIFLLCAGIIPLIAGGSWVEPFMIFLVYNLIVFTMATVDYFLISPHFIGVNRITEDNFSIGVKNPVKISLVNRGFFSLTLELKDDYPFQFKSDRKRIFTVTMSPGESREIEYFLTPLKRGKYSFGHIHIRAYSFLGLTGRRISIEKKQEVRVYPDLRNISRYQLMAIKGHLQRSGIKPVRLMGHGMEFESLREYMTDDEYRSINWKASARRGHLIVNQYDVEKSQNIMILIDAGRLMTAMAGEMAKFDYAVNAALMLCYVCTLRGDNAGLMVFGHDIKSYVPPGKGKKHLHMLLETLYEVEPGFVEPNYPACFKFLGTRSRKRSLVFLFTDLIDKDSSGELLKYFPLLFPHHIPFCVTIIDPVIKDIATRDCISSKEIYEQAIGHHVLWERKKALTIMEKKGVCTLDAIPSELSVRVINEYLKIKSRARL